MFGLNLLRRSRDAETYQLNRYRRPPFKLPDPCCEWCDLRLNSLSESVERLEKDLEQLMSASERAGDPMMRIRMDSALKILEHAVNVETGGGDPLLTHPDTLANAFKAYYRAVEEASAPSPSGSSNGKASQRGGQSVPLNGVWPYTKSAR